MVDWLAGWLRLRVWIGVVGVAIWKEVSIRPPGQILPAGMPYAFASTKKEARAASSHSSEATSGRS